MALLLAKLLEAYAPFDPIVDVLPSGDCWGLLPSTIFGGQRSLTSSI